MYQSQANRLFNTFNLRRGKVVDSVGRPGSQSADDALPQARPRLGEDGEDVDDGGDHVGDATPSARQLASV